MPVAPKLPRKPPDPDTATDSVYLRTESVLSLIAVR
jgi:hypothetical protein